ncbi:MAG: hypothetical protein AB7O62_10145 [Pirellulales bacterium]
MSRTYLASLAVLLAAVSSGCCMCSAPYDYTAPVYAEYAEDPSVMGIDDRYGSAFSGVGAEYSTGYEEHAAGYEGQIIDGQSSEIMTDETEVGPAPADDYYESEMEAAPRSTRRPNMHSALPRGR